MPIIKKTTQTFENGFENIANEENKMMNKNKNEIAFRPEDPKYTLDELILSEKLKDELKTIIDAKKYFHKIFETWNLKSVIKNGKSILANFYGLPGTGKTMAAHAVANALGKLILVVNYSEIESKYVGETEKNLDALFKFAKENDVVIFFDEADALLSKRVSNMSSSCDVSVNQTRSVLLNILNNFEGVILFASNFISNYDPAFMRRIQYHIEIPLPDATLREKLWRKYVPLELPTDLDVKEIAEKYENLSGSEISTAVLRAASKAATKEEDFVPKSYFHEATESILKSKSANSNSSKKIITSTKEISREEAIKNLGEEQVNAAEKECA